MSAPLSDRARAAAERLRAAVAEHAEGPDCGAPDCLFHEHRAAAHQHAMTIDTTTTANSATIDNTAIADRINATVTAYEGLRQRIFDALVERECPGWWLSTAFQNEGPDGIRSIEADAEGIYIHGSCWTSQTGGSTEYWDFTLPYDALNAPAPDATEAVSA